MGAQRKIGRDRHEIQFGCARVAAQEYVTVAIGIVLYRVGRQSVDGGIKEGDIFVFAQEHRDIGAVVVKSQVAVAGLQPANIGAQLAEFPDAAVTGVSVARVIQTVLGEARVLVGLKRLQKRGCRAILLHKRETPLGACRVCRRLPMMQKYGTKPGPLAMHAVQRLAGEFYLLVFSNFAPD